jgi:immune inhibitor A
VSRKLLNLGLLVGLFVVVALIVASAPPVAASSGAGSQDSPPNRPDDLPHPLGDAQRAARQEALAARAQGKAYGRTHQVASGQYVELEREGEDLIWTVLGEFADFPHNSIDEPDRTVDNTTYWVPDFTREHFMEMLFNDAPGANSMRNFYIEQSSGRYTVDGDVTEWIPVPGNAVDYGMTFQQTWLFVRDSVNGWYDAQIAAGKSPEEINEYLSQFDVWDRYDHDGDGNFNEPDGYIDHFQSVHSGEGEEAGGGALGAAAIWSHRWYVQLTPIGAGGPTLPDGTVVPFGGTQIGDSGYWIGDYTAEPENGAVGVFAHEFAHDLGLPDLYDTAGGENSTGFWTLMSSGSWTTGDPDNIGTKPTHMGAWEKFQLGWLNYDVAVAGTRSTHRLGPMETNTKQAQGLFVVLPDKELNTQIATPYAGDYFYYSGAGNNLDNFMYREFDLAPGANLTAQVRYNIELDWDYAYVVVSSDGGATWTSVETNRSTASNPNGQNFGHGITGNSGGWVELTADLSAYTGSTLVGFRYWTDVAVINPGFMADEIVINGEGPFGAETEEGWTLAGFRATTGQETSYHFNAYVAEFRQYWGYDDALRTGPYNFTGGNWVEHFPYQDGLLISYWDSSQSNNNTSSHPGSGLILPIDAHPEALIRADGQPWRNRMQTYDSTFTKEATDEITLHWGGVPTTHGGVPGVDLFDDNIQYWNPAIPTAGVQNPQTGTQIWIQSMNTQGNFMQVQVRPSR